MKSPGHVAYDAYCAAVDGKTWDGRPCPAWADLTEKIRNAWEAAARAVMPA